MPHTALPPLTPVAARLAAALCAGLFAAPSQAQEAARLQEVTITSTRADLQGTADSASEGFVTSKQLRTRPLLRAGDLMESVPGLVATQHAGEGKANQYFLRGFNLDHGTDFATLVDGVPVNLPTHGHGQGYTDLYFLIPELVDSVQYRKGPYYAQEGDFSAAGSARLRTVRRLAAPMAVLEAGGHGNRRALVAGSFDAGGGDLLLAAERGTDDGPWTVAQQLHKTNLVGKFSRGTDRDGWSVGLTHYEATWISTDQIPQRAVDSGQLGRFDSLDPTAGGHTRRTGLNAEWNQTHGARQTRVTAWALRYDFGLFSNFSYATRGCATDPLPPVCNSSSALDQFEQVDNRTALGLSASQQWPAQLGGLDAVLSVGTDLRRDHIGQVGLFDTLARTRLATVRSDSVRSNALGLWGQADMQLSARLRGVLGLRWDQRALNVSSSVAANSGSARASIFSPKAVLAYSLSERTDLYANWGRGFHSNDARGAVLRVDPRDGSTPADSATPLVRATGYEVGARQKWTPGLSTTAALWALRLDSELLFVGDAGTTEASRPSARSGVELTANWRPAPAWEVDADLSLSRARFRDADPAGDRVPGAMDRVFTLGLTWQQGAWTVGARLRHFGARALVEDNSVRASASTLVNTKLAYRFSPAVELSMEVFNLFNRKLNDIEYAYASRLPGEPTFAEGTTPATLHFHPSLPRTLRLGVKVQF